MGYVDIVILSFFISFLLLHFFFYASIIGLNSESFLKLPVTFIIENLVPSRAPVTGRCQMIFFFNE